MIYKCSGVSKQKAQLSLG